MISCKECKYLTVLWYKEDPSSNLRYDGLCCLALARDLFQPTVLQLEDDKGHCEMFVSKNKIDMRDPRYQTGAE